MAKKLPKSKAIVSINPNAEFVIHNENIDGMRYRMAADIVYFAIDYDDNLNESINHYIKRKIEDSDTPSVKKATFEFLETTLNITENEEGLLDISNISFIPAVCLTFHQLQLGLLVC